jgi:hypothetical protein
MSHQVESPVIRRRGRDGRASRWFSSLASMTISFVRRAKRHTAQTPQAHPRSAIEEHMSKREVLALIGPSWEEMTAEERARYPQISEERMNELWGC